MDDFSIGARAPLHQRRAPRAEHIDEEAPASVKCMRSALATLLMEQWAWGEISAPQVQQMAKAAITDGCQHPELLKLASLGSSGLCTGNCHRDLQRHLKVADKMPQAIAMTLPLQRTPGEVDGARDSAHDALAQVIGMLL